jgi:DNA repair protein RadC
MANAGLDGYEGLDLTASDASASGVRWDILVGRLSDGELLSLMAGGGETGAWTNERIQHLLSALGGVSGVWTAPVEELVREGGVHPEAAARIAAACELGRRALNGSRPILPVIRSPLDVAELVRSEAGDADYESFHVLLLDVRYRVIMHRMVTRGTLTRCLVDPRAVFRDAVRRGICSLLLAHNHPSGDPTPSQEDLEVTWRMVSAGRILGIEVLDHVIVGRPAAEGGSGHASMRELGLLKARESEEA